MHNVYFFCVSDCETPALSNETYKKTDKETYEETDKETNKETNKETDKDIKVLLSECVFLIIKLR